jgi:flagellar protein FlbD
MIEVSRLNGKKFVLNCELIKYIEATPDTVITLTTGEKMMVREGVDDLVRRTMDYRKRLYQEPPAVKN